MWKLCFIHWNLNKAYNFFFLRKKKKRKENSLPVSLIRLVVKHFFFLGNPRILCSIRTRLNFFFSINSLVIQKSNFFYYYIWRLSRVFNICCISHNRLSVVTASSLPKIIVIESFWNSHVVQHGIRLPWSLFSKCVWLLEDH